MLSLLVLQLALFAALLFFSAFFSSSETSFFSLTPRQLERMRFEQNPRSNLIERMLNQPRRLIVTILIGNELVNVAASVTMAAIVIGIGGSESAWINLFVMIPILLLVAEITPKTLALRHNRAFATAQSRPLDLFATCITPLREIVRRFSDGIITLLVGRERSPGSIVTEDMVRTLAEEAVGEGALDEMEASYIGHIFDLSHRSAGSLKTPRSQILFLPMKMSPREMVDRLRRAQHTRAPVFSETRDNILGVLHARDLLGKDLDALEREPNALRHLLRKPYLVPETRSASDLFLSLRSRRRSLALTVDEYGGVTGLVTMEDLLECIFGEIQSPSERVEERFERRREARYRVRGSILVAEFNQRTGSALPEQHARTLGGLLLYWNGELPQPGDVIEKGGLRFTITSLHGNRIHGIVVEGLESLESENSPRGEMREPKV